MNRKKITTMLLVVAAATSSLLLDSTKAFADTHSHNNKNNVRSFASESNSHKGKVINVDTNLRVRKGPSTSDGVIGYLRNGQTFDIIGRDGSWYKIKYEGRNGYIHKDYVKELDNDNDVEKGKVINITSVLTLRKEGSTKSKSLGYLRNGQTFDILAKEGSWYKIKVDGKVGYVYGEYVKVTSKGNENTSSKDNSKKDNKSNEKKSSESIKEGKVVNITTSLTVRKDSSTSSKSIGYLKNGEKLQIVSKSGSWYKIKYKGSYGYVYGEYVKVTNESSSKPENKPSSKPENKPSESIKEGKVVNITTSLTVRKDSSTSSKSLGYLKNGEKLEIVSKSGSWYKIKYKGSYGYVYGEYVKVTNESSSKPENKPSSKPENKPSESIKEGKVVNITTSLTVRKDSSTNSKSLGYLKNGEKLEIVSKSGSWYKIKYKGSYGYVYGEYVKITNENSGSSKPENKPNNKPENKPSEKPSNKFEGTGKVINITSNLRVRKGPGTNHGIVGYLVNGDTFDVLGKEGSWYKIKKGSLQGYISGEYVKFYSKDEKPDNKPDNKPNVKPESTKKYGRVNVGSELRIREKPNTNCKIIGNLRNGEVVEILGEENGFYKIKDAGITGYSSKEYIKEISEGDINNNITPDNGTGIHTNYHMSMSSYIKLQQRRVSSYSYDYFEKYINPNKASNVEQFLRLDEFRNVSISKLNSYLSNSGVLAGHAQGFVNACKKFGMDPIYFVAQSVHETGHGKSKLAKGVRITEIANPNKEIRNSKGELIGYEMIKLDKPVTVYNLFGIGAYDNSKAFPNRALILGTTYAYTHGWTSVDKAIEGAAKFVSDNYVNSSTYKQNTLYKMRFIPNVDLIWHQYATTPWYAKEIGDLIHEMRHIYSGNNDFVYDKPAFN
ncbi:SH3 domain-containing protein [Eubacterium multiforme]|uniref:SH3 domain-containing protein n=1 Tax=Eubacterium multiforme TaxID=83339 RepID=UPI003609A19E